MRYSWLFKSSKVRTTSFLGEKKSLFLSSLVERVLSRSLKSILPNLNFLWIPLIWFRPLISLLVIGLWEKLPGVTWRALGLTLVERLECFSDTVAGSRCKPQTYMLMTIWNEDFLFSNSLGFKPCKLLVSISPLPNTLSLYIGVVLTRPSQNKLIWFSDVVLLFVSEWRQNTE